MNMVKFQTLHEQNGLHLDGMVGAAAPPMLGSVHHLQNLAYLGPDGNVHSVNNGLKGNSAHMLGATAPHLALVNLGLLADLKNKANEHGIDATAVKSGAHKAGHIAAIVGHKAGGAALDASKVGTALAAKTANFAMSDEGK